MEVNLRLIIKENPESKDAFGGTFSEEYNGVTYRISGDHMIIEGKNDKNEVIGHIRPIKEIKTYKTWQ